MGRGWATGGLCSALTLTIGHCPFQADFYAFSLGMVDVILGVTWLCTIGDVSVNRDSMTMHFLQEGKKPCLLEGDSALLHQSVSLRALQKSTNVDWAASYGTWWSSRPPNLRILGHCVPFWTILGWLRRYVKHSPIQPDRLLHLLVGSVSSISVQSYRYGHVQKDGIERLVGNMLSTASLAPTLILSRVMSITTRTCGAFAWTTENSIRSRLWTIIKFRLFNSYWTSYGKQFIYLNWTFAGY